MKKNKIRPDETPVQLGKAELLESTKTVHEANGDITDHVHYRVPPRMDIYTSVPAFKGGWSSDKERKKKQKANDKYWKEKREHERKAKSKDYADYR